MQERKNSVFGTISVAIVLFGLATLANSQTPTITVTVDRSKIAKGGKVEVTIKSSRDKSIQAVLLQPTIGVISLELHPDPTGASRTTINVDEKSPDGLYVIHAWTGPKEHPTAVGKASFRIGNIVAD